MPNISSSTQKSKGSQKVRIRVGQPYSLANLGYHMNESETKRHDALRKAVAKYGYATTIRKLSPLVVWHKRQGTDYRKIAKSDERFIGRLRDEKKLK